MQKAPGALAFAGVGRGTRRWDRGEVRVIIDLTSGLGSSLARRYLQRHPRLAAIEESGTRVVIFQVPHDLDWFSALQHALDEAVASEPDAKLFLALTSLPDIVRAKESRARDGESPWTQPTEPHFLGSIALGEGGVLFVAADGAWLGAPNEEQVLALLER